MQAFCMCLMHIELPIEEEMSRDFSWKTIGEEKAFSTPIFDGYLADRTGPEGRKGRFVWLDSPDWVVIIPWLLVDGVPHFIMEEQWRHGPCRMTREFPAGLVEKGEEAAAAAGRELLEETGCTGDFTLLGCVNPNPAFMANHQSYFLAENIRKISDQNLDENEEIKVLTVPVEEALRDMGTGLYDNGIMMAAAGFFMRYAEKRKDLRQSSTLTR